MNAISLVMETGFAVTAFLALFLNLFLPEEIEDDAVDVDGKEAGGAAVTKQGPSVPIKGVDSSRASDAESLDRIEQQQQQHAVKEVSP